MKTIVVDKLDYSTVIGGSVDGVLLEAFPRKCDTCGCGMIEGYVVGDDGYSCGATSCEKSLDISFEQMGYKTREEAYEDNAYFYTDWYQDAIQEGDVIYTEKGEEIKVKLVG